MEEQIFEFNLGDKVKDRITGLTGIVVSRTQWYNGCIRYQVQPPDFKDGKPVETTGFDEQELDLVTSGAVKPKDKEIPTGGPMPAPTMRR